MKKNSLLLSSLGCAIIILGVCALILMPFIVTNIIYKQISLEPHTEAYHMWKDIPLPIYQRFYLFNVTNAADIERYGAKPELVEVGPFTYVSKWHKSNIDYHPNGTVSYKEVKTHAFVEELSYGNESEVITTLNGPLAITLSLLQNAQPAVRVVVTLALDAVTEGFFIKRTVKQLLFSGYPDLLTSFGPLLNSKIPTNNNGKFGWLLGRNASDDGLFTVHTGKNDINMINVIDAYKGKHNLTYWVNGSDCNSISDSTNGEIFPPIKDKDSLYLFHPDFCRRWKLQFNDSRVSNDGITAYRYIPDENTFKNDIDYPPNSCYKSKLPQNVSPAPLLLLANTRSNSVKPKKIRFASGVFDMSGCKYGAPVVMSFPHFYKADPVYLTTVDGLQPNASRHEFFIEIEPTIGTSVKSAARIQINVFINKPPGLFRYRHIPEIVFPIFWQELSVDLTRDFADNIKWVLKQPSLVSSISSSLLLSIGTLLVFISLLFPLISHYMSERAKHTKAGSDCCSDKTSNSQIDDVNEIIVYRNNEKNLRKSEENGVCNPALDPS